MTVPSTSRRAGPFTGTGALVSYPFTFKVTDATELRVVVADTSDAESTLVLNSSFLVTLNGDQETSPGGSVQYAVGGVATALPSGYVLVVTGENVAYGQASDLPTGGAFSPTVYENALDQLAKQIMTLRDQLGRTVMLADTTAGVNPSLPVPAASALLGWSVDGASLVNYAQTGGAGVALADLQSTASGKGAALVGFSYASEYATGGIGLALQQAHVATSLLEYIPRSQWAAIEAGTSAYDATSVIQSALTAAGSIVVPDGTYVVGPLNVASGTRIYMGANAVFKAKTGYGVNDRLLNIINVNDVEVFGGTIQMLRSEYAGVVNEQRHCVMVSGTNRVKLIRVKAIDSGGDGFYVGGAADCTDVLLEDCVASNHFRNSLSITRGNRITVLRGQYSQANGTVEAPAGPWAGIDVEPNASTTLDNVVIDGAECFSNNGNGILCSGPSAALTDRLTIRNCKVHDNLLQGIKPAYVQKLIVDCNEVWSNTTGGIEDTTALSLWQRITNNTIYSNGGAGIKGFSSKAVISGNTVLNAGGDGIKWQFGQFVNISGNEVCDSGGHGITYERAYNSAITGNVVMNSQFHGIFITGTSTSSVTKSRNWSVSGNSVFASGLATDNTYAGIYADANANTGTITGNVIKRADSGNQPINAIFASDATVKTAGNETSLGAKSGNSQISVGGVALASFINNGDVQGINAIARTYITSTVWIGGGTGTPEGAQAAGIGSIWMRTDGGAGTSHYVKESGTGNTGWVAK